MRDRLYQKHRFDAADWESAIAGSLNGWKQAIEDGWVSKESIFIVILVSSAHEFFGDPFCKCFVWMIGRSYVRGQKRFF